MKINKLLVTGGAGFIGLNFVQLCVEKKIQVVVVDKMTYAANKEAKPFFKKNKIRLIEKDINDLKWEDIKDEKIDVIVNFAAESHVDNSIKNPKVFVETNVNGTLNLLLIAKEHKIRFHQISTDEVYGDLPLENKKLKFDVDSQIKPSSPYSSSKASADLLALAFAHTYGMNLTVTRCSNNYGPYQNDEKLIPLTIKHFLSGKPMKVYGDGKNVRDWIYVQDHNEAVLHILKTQKTGVFNVGSNNEIDNLSIVNTIGTALKVPKDKRVEFVKDRLGHDRRYAINPRSMREIGWEPKISFKDGITKTIKFYEDKWSKK